MGFGVRRADILFKSIVLVHWALDTILKRERNNTYFAGLLCRLNVCDNSW